jgi:hypothetical protein
MEMSPNNATVFNCSLKKYNQLLRVYGTGSLAELTLLKLIYKYACHSPTEKTLQRLDSMISYLQSSNETICIDTLEGNFFPGGIGDDDDGSTPTPPDPDPIPKNRAPSVDGKLIELAYVGGLSPKGPQYTLMHTFDISDFTVNFSDPDGDSYGNVIVTSLPAQGFLLYNGQEVAAGSRVLAPELLEYWLLYDTSIEVNTTFNFRISDDNLQNPMYSSAKTITLRRYADSIGNQSATIGDNTVYAENLATTVLIPSMFTDGNPAYSDPENDPLDAIRIDRIGSNNLGVYNYNGSPVVIGQIITSAELSAGAFIHVGASTNDISSDTLEFSARDTGSLIWVD